MPVTSMHARLGLLLLLVLTNASSAQVTVVEPLRHSHTEFPLGDPCVHAVTDLVDVFVATIQVTSLPAPVGSIAPAFLVCEAGSGLRNVLPAFITGVPSEVYFPAPWDVTSPLGAVSVSLGLYDVSTDTVVSYGTSLGTARRFPAHAACTSPGPAGAPPGAMASVSILSGPPGGSVYYLFGVHTWSSLSASPLATPIGPLGLSPTGPLAVAGPFTMDSLGRHTLTTSLGTLPAGVLVPAVYVQGLTTGAGGVQLSKTLVGPFTAGFPAAALGVTSFTLTSTQSMLPLIDDLGQTFDFALAIMPPLPSGPAPSPQFSFSVQGASGGIDYQSGVTAGFAVGVDATSRSVTPSDVPNAPIRLVANADLGSSPWPSEVVLEQPPEVVLLQETLDFALFKPDFSIPVPPLIAVFPKVESTVAPGTQIPFTLAPQAGVPTSAFDFSPNATGGSYGFYVDQGFSGTALAVRAACNAAAPTLMQPIGPLTITSYYRNPRHNLFHNGGLNSRHVRGLAVDIATTALPAGVRPVDLYRAAWSAVPGPLTPGLQSSKEVILEDFSSRLLPINWEVPQPGQTLEAPYQGVSWDDLLLSDGIPDTLSSPLPVGTIVQVSNESYEVGPDPLSLSVRYRLNANGRRVRVAACDAMGSVLTTTLEAEFACSTHVHAAPPVPSP